MQGYEISHLPVRVAAERDRDIRAPHELSRAHKLHRFAQQGGTSRAGIRLFQKRGNC